MEDARERGAAELIYTCRVALFDCDDTLIATAKKRWDILVATAAQFGVDLKKETIRAAWGLPFNQLISTIVPTLDPAAYVRVYQAAMREVRPEATEGAIQLLEHLSRVGVTMEVVTSSSKEMITQDLDDLGLTDYFDNIYGHEETRFHKPDPRVLSLVIDGLLERGFTRADTVFIGDSVRDYRVATGNSIEFIAVLSGLEVEQDFLGVGLAPNRIVKTLANLLQ